MKQVGSISVSLSLLFVLACVMNRTGGADDRAGVRPTLPSLPGLWVLLEDRPRLWNRPGGEATEERLEVSALQRIRATEAAPGDDIALQWIRVERGDQAGWLPDALLAPPPTELKPASLQSIGSEIVDRFHGIPPEYAPPDLVEVGFGYEVERTYLLRREAAIALEKMIRAARREGLNIQVVSAYRSYETQRSVYLNKLKRSGWTQQTVAKPGHSEHQLGTTVDLTGQEESTLLEQAFGETPEGRWLRRRAPEFGFAVTYTENNREQTGYAPEPWHFRYYGTDLAPGLHTRALGREPG